MAPGYESLNSQVLTFPALGKCKTTPFVGVGYLIRKPEENPFQCPHTLRPDLITHRATSDRRPPRLLVSR